MTRFDAIPVGTQQFFRFLVVGVLSTMVNYATFYVLYCLSVEYLLASSIGFLVGVLVGFELNRTWTYRSNAAVNFSLAARYGFVYVCSLGVSVLMLRALVSRFGLPPTQANVAAICVTTCTNFIGTKLLVFRN